MKASFSHLPLLDFEGCLARKLRFHIFHFQFLKDVSHEMQISIVFCKCWNGCPLEWLHQGCDSDSSADILNFGASDFPFQIPFKKCFEIFFLSILFCNSVLANRFANRIVMAGSRLLGAAAVCVVLFPSFCSWTS